MVKKENDRPEYKTAKVAGKSAEALRERMTQLPGVTRKGLRDGVNEVRGEQPKKKA